MHPAQCLSALSATALYRSAAGLWAAAFAVATTAAISDRPKLQPLTSLLVGAGTASLIIGTYKHMLQSCDEQRRIAWWSGRLHDRVTAHTGLIVPDHQDHGGPVMPPPRVGAKTL